MSPHLSADHDATSKAPQAGARGAADVAERLPPRCRGGCHRGEVCWHCAGGLRALPAAADAAVLWGDTTVPRRLHTVRLTAACAVTAALAGGTLAAAGGATADSAFYPL